MTTTTIQIENLKCNGCASTVKKGLLKFDEVENVTIDLENSLVEISYKGNEENEANYKAKLKGLGYPEAGKNTNFSIAKSYVSCAIGKVSQ